MASMKTAAGYLGVSGVALGAFGAHALKSKLSAAGMIETWQTAVQYHLVHAAALLALAGFLARTDDAGSSRSLRITGWSWLVGVVLFSGSLYVMALGGPRWLGPVTPLGGAALLAGWVLLIIPSKKKSSGFGGR